MKKTLLLLTFLTISTSAFSQWGAWGNFCSDCYTGIEVGMVSSNISGFEGASAKTGFYAGFYQYAYLSDELSLRYGLSYSNIGSEVDGFDNPFIIHSINTPLSLHYIFKEQFQVFAGGELGTNLFGKFPNNDGDFVDDFDFNENIAFLDASAFAGVGYILNNTIDFSVRYNFGLTNLYGGDIEGAADWKKNWLTLSVGYTFRDF